MGKSLNCEALPSFVSGAQRIQREIVCRVLKEDEMNWRRSFTFRSPGLPSKMNKRERQRKFRFLTSTICRAHGDRVIRSVIALNFVYSIMASIQGISRA